MSAGQALRKLKFHLRDLIALAKEHERKQLDLDFRELETEIETLEKGGKGEQVPRD